jgi:carotenoid cleavage dioxygenase
MEDGWNGIHVVDLDGQVQVFETEKFFHVHIANTFENETGIVMDIGTFPAIPFSPHFLETELFLNKTSRDRKNYRLHVERMHLHLAGAQKGQVTRQILSPPGRPTDFFKINDLRSGLPYCIYYAVEWFHDDKAYASMAILKHDICQNKRLYWAMEDSYPSEPFFIQTGTESDAEDAGLVVFVTLDGRRKASDFMVLDAKTFETVATVKLPVHIPFLAHGQFIPTAARDAVRAAIEDEHPMLSAAIEATFTV